MRARLVVLAGGPIGAGLELEPRSAAWTVGRAEGCDLCLSARGLSRRHAALVYDGEAWRVRDLGSRNGTRRAGRKLADEERLEDQDELKLGELVLRFQLVGAEEAARSNEELEFALEATPAQASPPPRSPRPPVAAPPPAGATPSASRPTAPPRQPSPAELERERLRTEALRRARGTSSGAWSADLGQYPWPLRWSLYLGVLALGGLAAWGAFLLMQGLRAGG